MLIWSLRFGACEAGLRARQHDSWIKGRQKVFWTGEGAKIQKKTTSWDHLRFLRFVTSGFRKHLCFNINEIRAESEKNFVLFFESGLYFIESIAELIYIHEIEKKILLTVLIQTGTSTSFTFVRFQRARGVQYNRERTYKLAWTLHLEHDSPVSLTLGITFRLLTQFQYSDDNRLAFLKGAPLAQIQGTGTHAYWYKQKPLAIDIEATGYALMALVFDAGVNPRK